MTPHELCDEACRLYYEDGSDEARAQARELYLKAAEEKYIVSAVYLGGIAFDEGDYKASKRWWGDAFLWYGENPTEEAKGMVAYAHVQYGHIHFYNYEEIDPLPDFYRQMAVLQYMQGHEMGCDEGYDELGQCLYEDNWMPGCKADVEGALKTWQKGMEKGDQRCALHYCAHFIDNDLVDQDIIDLLEGLVRDEENPCADACALLYEYYSRIGDEALAAEWMECGLEMGSEMMQAFLDDERDAETGVEESEEEGEPCVVVVDTDGCFRIVQADAKDWRSLPALIDAEGTDNMRCAKFNNVSQALGLKGNLLGMLDRDAFRKPDLELNWHASQWYDGMADLAGDMIICLEDSRYNPFSFANEAEAQRVIDALRR